jgi:hypothetical protein
MTPKQTSLLRIFLWLLLALGFGIIALVADAAEPGPAAAEPTPLRGGPAAAEAIPATGPGPATIRPHLTHLTWALLAADAASRGLDVYSTRRMIANGHRELFLPQAIAKQPAAMAAMEAGDLALQYWAARRLEKAHHRKLARIALAIDIGQDAPWAIRNLYLNREKTAPTLRPRLLPTR